MALLDNLKNKVNTYFTERYEVQETTIVPSTDYSKLTFGNNGLAADLTFLFVDIRKSSQLHDTYGIVNAAKIYQSFHDINVRIINSRDGQVRAFDGDRIMGVFSGSRKNTNAVEAALNIRWAIQNILNPKLPIINPLNIGIGIDTGKTLITKVGKGRDSSNNDLVWVGKACNYASHMCNESVNEIYISPKAYSDLESHVKISQNRNIWTNVSMKLKNGSQVPCWKTSYWLEL